MGILIYFHFYIVYLDWRNIKNLIISIKSAPFTIRWDRYMCAFIWRNQHEDILSSLRTIRLNLQTVKSVTSNVINAITMNKMVIIAGEIATGPGLGSSSVIINKIRQQCGRWAARRLVAVSARLRVRATESGQHRTAASRCTAYRPPAILQSSVYWSNSCCTLRNMMVYFSIYFVSITTKVIEIAVHLRFFFYLLTYIVNFTFTV